MDSTRCACGHARRRHVEYSGPTHDTEWGACTRMCGCREYTNLAAWVAGRTQDAYSADRYGLVRWTRLSARFLAGGYDARETEAVLRSKWTRWAMDARGPRASALALYLYIDGHLGPDGLAELVEGTFA